MNIVVDLRWVEFFAHPYRGYNRVPFVVFRAARRELGKESPTAQAAHYECWRRVVCSRIAVGNGVQPYERVVGWRGGTVGITPRTVGAQILPVPVVL